MDNATAAKVCTKCGLAKPLGDYSPNPRAKDGRRTACKRCAVAYAARYAQAVAARPEPPPVGTKRCGVCEEVKPRTEFHVRRASTDGRMSRCKTCAIALRRTYSKENPDKTAATGKAWRDKNPGYSGRNAKKWRAANPDGARKNRDRWAAENAEHLAAAKQAWSKANRDRVNELRDPEITRRWRRLNADAHREAQARRRAAKQDTAIGPIDLDALWTGVCGICRTSLDRQLLWPDPMSRSLDHIVPLSRSGTHTQDNLQWTHLRCNVSKGARLPETG